MNRPFHLVFFPQLSSIAKHGDFAVPTRHQRWPARERVALGFHLRAGVAVNRNLYETILRELLIERAEHTVQLYDGSGTQWRKVK